MEKIVITILGDGPEARRTFFGLVDSFSGPAVKRTLLMCQRPGEGVAFLIGADKDVQVKLTKP
jgi:hypothetical protein